MAARFQAAGEYRRRITLRAVTRVEDEGGGYAETTSDVATVRAHVEPLQGAEQVDAMQVGMNRPHRFTIRHRAGVTGASEIQYDGRTFNVRSVVDPDERHVELVILADEVIT